MKIEFFWNRIILQRYGNQIKIDKNNLIKKIKNKLIENEYLLSEIFLIKIKKQVLMKK